MSWAGLSSALSLDRTVPTPRRLKLLIQRVTAKTPVEIRRWMPEVTLDPLDLVLAAYEARGNMITILQIGACDGVNRDPVRHQILKGNTRAVLVEPNPLAFERLQKAYAGIPNVTLVQAAIGDQDGSAHFYRVKKSATTDPEALQVASFYREHLERHGRKPDDIEQIDVPCRSLGSLVAELDLAKIDLLQIDAEGFDAAVVRMALKMPVQPDCINFEHIHLKTPDRLPLFELLKAGGYLLSYDAWNILALQKSRLEELKNGPDGPPST
jgi:FkbM family methyltransferase